MVLTVQNWQNWFFGLSLCHKLWFSIPINTSNAGPQTMVSGLKKLKLKYQWYAPTVCKDIARD